MPSKYLRQIERILEISHRMLEIKSLNVLLDYIIYQAIEEVGAERGYVILAQPNGELKVQVKRSKGVTPAEDYDQISASIVTETINSGRPLILANALNDSRFRKTDGSAELQLRSIICVPLITVENKPIGAIYVENQSDGNRFFDDDLPALTRLARQASLAINNTATINELEEQVTDCTQQLENFRSEMLEINQTRKIWLSNMAHDLRAPLGIAVTALSLLQEEELGPLNQAQKEWVGKSLSAIQHSNNLINDLFFLFTIEAGGLKLQTEETSLEEFLHGVYDVARGLPWAEDVALELDIPADLPRVEISPLRIRQVLLNLLSNAQKFTNQGRVVLYATPQTDEVLIGVRDTGEGIATDMIALLFQRFEQVDPNIVRRRKGTGLGLAICRELVEAHDGRIWVESAAGQGADFMFTLPLSPNSR